MFCYRDMTFCMAEECRNTDCKRHQTHLIHNKDNLPVALSDFHEDCEDYKEGNATKL